MFNCSFSIFFKIKSKTRNSLVIYFPPEIDVKIFFDINPVWIRKQESMKVGGGGLCLLLCLLSYQKCSLWNNTPTSPPRIKNWQFSLKHNDICCVQLILDTDCLIFYLVLYRYNQNETIFQKQQETDSIHKRYY